MKISTKIIKSKDTIFFDDLNDLGFGAGDITLTIKNKNLFQKVNMVSLYWVMKSIKFVPLE